MTRACALLMLNRSLLHHAKKAAFRHICTVDTLLLYRYIVCTIHDFCISPHVYCARIIPLLYRRTIHEREYHRY